MGSMYSSVFFLGIQIATSVQPVVYVERTVFYRERAAGLYAALPFAFGQVRDGKLHFSLLSDTYL